MKKSGRNAKVGIALAVFVAAMIGLAYASVPLYTLFCRATGLGGTTQRAAAAPAQTKDRYVTVSFDGNVDSALPWDFGPEVKSVRIKLGEVTTVKYHARNNGDKTLVGTATFNVQPAKAGSYFNKIQCFCFTKQVLKPGQYIELPVQFFVDPAMAADREDDDVQNITLSYTFFRAKDQSLAVHNVVNRMDTGARDKSKPANP